MVTTLDKEKETERDECQNRIDNALKTFLESPDEGKKEILSGRGECLKAILESAKDTRQLLEAKGIKENTALLWVCSKKRLESADVDCIRVLLEAGASTEAKNKDGKTAHELVTDEDVRRLLSTAGPAKDRFDMRHSNEGKLCYAAANGNTHELELLLKDPDAKAFMNKTDWEGNTALINAVKGGHMSAVKALLKSGASTTERDKDKQTALDIAVKKGYEACAKALFARDKSGLYSLVVHDAYADIVEAAVICDPSLAQSSVDADNRPAKGLATGKCKEKMFEVLYLLGRYELQSEAPVHRSKTCLVYYAVDQKPSRPGESQYVAVKLMRNKDQFDREKIFRDGLESAVVRVVDTTEIKEDDKRNLGRLKEAMAGLLYRHVLVMEKGDDDLASYIAHAHMSVKEVRDVARSLGRCLEVMHDKGLIHGDFKPLNAMGVTRNGQRSWMLIDLDAATKLGSCVGTKWSTAYNPPELMYRVPPNILDKAGTTDYGSEGDCYFADGTVVKPAAPTVRVPGGGEIRVRAVEGAHGAAESKEKLPPVDRRKKTDTNGNPLDGLLFESLAAHPTFDIWSYGVVVYEMMTGQRLWHEDRECNIARVDDYAVLHSWTDAAKAEALSRVPDLWGRALLWWLLSKEPAARPQSFDAVLKHPFFSEPLAHPSRLTALAGAADARSGVFFCHTAGMHVQLAAKEAVDLLEKEARVGLSSIQEAACGIPGPGVAKCSHFVLVVTPGVLRDAAVQAAASAALKEKGLRIVLVLEMEARALPRCRRCRSWPAAEALYGHAGQPPTRCADHKAERMELADVAAGRTSLNLPVYNVANDGSATLHIEAALKRSNEPALLAKQPAAAAPAEAPGKGAAPEAELAKQLLACEAVLVPWSADPDCRTVSLALLMHELGLGADPRKAQPLFFGLACERAAPVLKAGEGKGHHVCIVHASRAQTVCQKIESDLRLEFNGAKVTKIDESVKESVASDVVRDSSCVLLFLTKGLFAFPSLVQAVVRARAASVRFVVLHETEVACGGYPAFEDYMLEAAGTKKDLQDVLDASRSIPWRHDSAFQTVVALKLLNAGLMDPPEGSAHARCAEHAVSLKFLREFKEELDKKRSELTAAGVDWAKGSPRALVTTQDVVTNFIMPETQTVSYVTLQLQKESRIRNQDWLWYPADSTQQMYFVSHAFVNPFDIIYERLSEHFKQLGIDETKAFVWLDIFAVNQHDTESELREGNTLKRTVVLSKKTLMVLDAEAKPLSRLWCLYEVAATEHNKLELLLPTATAAAPAAAPAGGVTAADEAAAAEATRRAAEEQLIRKVYSSNGIDAERAECFSPTAERVIHDNIKRRYGTLGALTNHLKVLLTDRIMKTTHMTTAADDVTM